MTTAKTYIEEKYPEYSYTEITISYDRGLYIVNYGDRELWVDIKGDEIFIDQFRTSIANDQAEKYKITIEGKLLESISSYAINPILKVMVIYHDDQAYQAYVDGVELSSPVNITIIEDVQNLRTEDEYIEFTQECISVVRNLDIPIDKLSIKSPPYGISLTNDMLDVSPSELAEIIERNVP